MLNITTGEGLSPETLELWERLALSSNSADPVCCGPDWQLAWGDVFAPDQKLFWSADSDALAIFSCTFFSGEPVVLYPLENSWRFGCPLLGADPAELFSVYMNQMFLHFKWPIVPVLSGIRPNSRLERDLFQRCGKNFSLRVHEEYWNCCASLENGLDGWLGRRSANHRAKLRKARRKALDAGIVFERHIPWSAAEAEEVYQRMLEVEIKSWKGIEKCGMAETPAREFYAALMRRLSRRGGARVIFATLDGQTIGYIFGTVLGPYYRGQQFSYDQAFASLSPGNLLQHETVAWLCEDGFIRYDMGPVTGPRMAYKEHWTEQNLHCVTLVMTPLLG